MLEPLKCARRVCVKNRSPHGSWLPIPLFIFAILSHAFVRFTRMEWQIWCFRAIICTAAAADHGSVNATDDTINHNPTSLDFRFVRAVPHTVLISNLNIFSIGKLSRRCLFNIKCISFLLRSVAVVIFVWLWFWCSRTMWDMQHKTFFACFSQHCSVVRTGKQSSSYVAHAKCKANAKRRRIRCTLFVVALFAR